MTQPIRPDSLDPEDETIPVGPARRRFQIAFGLLIIALILGALVWFAASNTETDQGPIRQDPPELSG